MILRSIKLQQVKKIVLALSVCCLFLLKTTAQEHPRKNEVYEIRPPGFSYQAIEVKKKLNNKICDTCNVQFAFSADWDFSYVLVGTPHMLMRLHSKIMEIKESIRGTEISNVQFTPYSTINVFLLPNYIVKEGEKRQIWRDYKGIDYSYAEYIVVLNNKNITDWIPLATEKQSNEYAIRTISAKSDDYTVITPWPGSVFVGTYKLNINDSLKVLVRDTRTKKNEKGIFIQRLKDVPDNFSFLQLPKLNEKHNNGLQDFLNANIKKEDVIDGDSSVHFEKDADKTGILLFQTERNDVLEYSYDDTLHWQSIKPGNFIGAHSGTSLVVDKELPSGTTKALYLRYQHQPETVHKITIHAKAITKAVPWAKIAITSILLLLLAGIWFYLYSRWQKRKMAKLDKKNKDIETRLSLLSGQLNPHFLFNSLHAIQGVVNTNNTTEANAYIGDVARFMRNIMDQGKKEFISLKEELQLETDYLQLEQKRKSFEFVMDIDEQTDISQIDFPPLLLQPVLENSVRHAFGRTAHPVLSIKIERQQKNLVITITDNGAGWNMNEHKEGHGLGLVRKRIELINEKIQHMNIEMKIQSQTGTGTTTVFICHNWLM